MNVYDEGFEPRKPLDYDAIDQRVVNSVRNMEEKPHIRFIRYLLTKRYSPTSILQNLTGLGLSSPHVAHITAYYLAVVDPMVKKYNLAPLYADYKNKLLRKNSRYIFNKSILNYNLDVRPTLDMQANFCLFIKEFEVDRLWVSEIYRAHKNSAKDMPVDSLGKVILDTKSFGVTPEKIIMSPKRYMVDKMILEGVTNSRIAKYASENLGLKSLKDTDIHVYRRYFFNIQAQSIEEKLDALNLERESLKVAIKQMSARNPEDVDGESGDIGNKIATIKQNEQRIIDLDDNIRTLNMMHSEYAHKQAVVELEDYKSMFSDVMKRASRRFQQLDQATDRDVVDPLLKTAKIMEMAYEKITKMEETVNSNSQTDHGSSAAVAELCHRRLEDIVQEEKERASKALSDDGDDPFGQFDVNEVMGINKLGVSFETDQE